MHLQDGEGHRVDAGSADNPAALDRALIEQFPDALIVCRGADVVFANRKAVEIFGAGSSAELVGRPAVELVHPDGCDGVAGRQVAGADPPDAAASPAGAPPNVRFLNLRDGGAFLCSVRISAISWIEGDGRLLTIRPLDDGTAAAVPFRDQLIAVFENAPFAFTLKDLDGRYIATNREYMRLTGGTSESFTGKTAKDFFSPDMAKLLEEMDRWMLESGKPVTVEFELNEDYAREGYRELTKFPIFSDNGDICAIGCVGIDSTRRRQSEVDLLRREIFLSALLECTVDGILTLAEDGTIKTLNRQASQMFAYAEEHIVGRPLSMLVQEPYRGQYVEQLANYLSTGAPGFLGVRREVVALKSDGTAFSVELAFAEIVAMDGSREFVGALRDISARKALENQLHHSQKLKAIGQLTGGIAHDFNNLLTVVGINSRLLSQLLSDPTQLEMAGSISRAADRGAALVRQLLSYSRQAPLRPELFEVGEIMIELRSLLRRTLSSTVRLDFRMPGPPMTIRADRTQLETALLNIVLNARDAMPAGGTVVVEAKRVRLAVPAPLPDGADLAAGRYVVIAIIDEGGGIPEAVIDQVFDPFFTTKEIGEGSGLGLSMVYGFARQSGGDATIESTVGVGTTVKIFLPEASSLSDSRAAGDSARAKAEGTVLVFEADEVLRCAIVSELERVGYRVFDADTQEAALSVLRENADIDILLADRTLPCAVSGGGKNGSSDTINPPRMTIVMSSNAAKLSEKYLRSDGDWLIEKPFEPATLVSTVRHVFQSDRR